MNKKVIGISIVIVFVLLIALLESKKTNDKASDKQTVVTPTTDYSATQTITPTSSSATAQLEPVSPEDGIDSAVSKITQALQAPTASQFQSLLIDDMVLGNESGGSTSETNKAAVMTWLNSHWSNNLRYVSKNYVAHFGSWEIETTGWSNISGTVTLKLFRYDADGQRQAFSGNWLIWGVFY